MFEWLPNVCLLSSLSAMLSSVSHSSTFVLVSSTGVFLWTSLFRWASEQGLCVFQSPRIPLWTLSGFGLCAALPVSIKRSVGAGVWHRHRTWWETAEQSQTVEHNSSYFLHRCHVLTLSTRPLSSLFVSVERSRFLSFIAELNHCSIRTVKPWVLRSHFVMLKRFAIWKLLSQTLTKWSQDDLCFHVFVPLCVLGENEFNDLQGLTMLRGAAEVQGFLPSRPLFHLQLAELRLDGCRMERWQDKKQNRHVSPPYPPRPTRALT